MSEQTFRSPGFFEQEIELAAPGTPPTGVPGGLIGAGASGPAFVPTTVASFSDFEARFGGLNPKFPASYAANEFLKHKGSLTFIRILGAGANSNTSDFNTTLSQGTVRNAGFKVTGSTIGLPPGDLRKTNTVQFLAARHSLPADTTSPSEWKGFPVFSDNPSFNPGSSDTLNIIRGVLMFPTGARGMLLDMTGSGAAWTGSGAATDDVASTDLNSSSPTYKKFKFAISSSLGSVFSSTDGVGGVKMVTASLDPRSSDYFGKVLNTDPRRLQEDQHCLYLDFAVEDELTGIDTVGMGHVAILSGSSTYLQNFGRFDARYSNARTPAIISQPYGSTEYDLFNFETLSDGAGANEICKVSIASVKASVDPRNPYGTFDVVVRDLYDTDTNPRILEVFGGCDLNPLSANFVAKKVGDKKVTFNFDATDESERRLQVAGRYPNASRRIRVVPSAQLDSGLVPASALPFGFRGIPVVRTTQTLTDTSATLSIGGRSYGTPAGATRLQGVGSFNTLDSAIVPPLPFRFKVTQGALAGLSYIGAADPLETPDSRLYWGVKFERLPATGSVTNSVMNANAGTEFNPLISSYAKMQGIEKLDALVTGSDADAFNANKFTLARVAFSNQTLSDVTGTVESHMKETAYIRNGTPSTTDYRINDAGASLDRLTFASLLSGSAQTFNKFSEYAKFSTMFYGGFDGVNIFDESAALLGDRATSTEAGGRAAVGAAPIAASGLGYNPGGEELANNAVSSYRTAARMMTDKLTVNVNIMAIPGIKDPLITDYLSRRLDSYAYGMYVMDSAAYDDNNNRLFDDSTGRPNVSKTIDAFTARGINNNYAATYFPDVYVNDVASARRVKVPASIAALGALAYSDKVAYPWYAPAGFNRGALDFVSNVEVRLSTADRDSLYDANINPIGTFPGSGFVIFGQKTLQLSRSALDRVNVRRLFLELKRVIAAVARGLIFEPNDKTTRQRFIDQATPLLNLIRAQAGIEQFRIVMDDTNNTPSDVAASRLNGRIVFVPTRAVEFIAVDFIITPAGVEFV